MWPSWFLRSRVSRSLHETPVSPAQSANVRSDHAPPIADRAQVPAVATPAMPDPRSTHRSRTLAMRLEHSGLCGERICARLASAGIRTVGDLAYCTPAEVAKQLGLSSRSVIRLRRYRRTVRLAASVPMLSVRDAKLLVAIHRRSFRTIAGESATALYQDLRRYADSTEGRRQMRGQRLPSLKRVRRWIDQSASITSPSIG